MKKILNIARLELSILFYSPIAWLVLIIFILQCGVSFTDILYATETKQQMGSVLETVTKSMFGGFEGFFSAVQKKLYLYIPLLTMGLMSREISSGSLKLLLSSPVTNLQIILGKFVAMMAYGGILMLVLLGIMISGVFSIEHMDIQYVLGGMLGLYLLICAYAAIGLFMSSLTSYQVVAAISTLAILAALNFVSKIGPGIDFVRDITYWLSIAGRADNFINGLISSKDVVYFLMVIFLFLTLSIMKLDAGREIRSQSAHIMRYAAVILIVVVVGVVTSMPTLTAYYDTTRFKTNTLTDESLAIIKQLKKPVTITTYPNVNNSYAHLGAPKFRNFELRQFEQYSRYLPGIKFKYVAYYDTAMARNDKTKTLEEKAQRAATAHGYEFSELLSPKEIKKVINLVPEDNFFTRTISYDGKQTFLRMFFDMVGYPQEAEITAALKRLLTQPATVGVLASNDERSINKKGDKAYKDVTNTLNRRSSLINQGFDVKTIELAEKDTIPQNLSVLILADPKTPYTPLQLQKIASYIEKGGNILIAGEPGKQQQLNQLLQPLGVEYMQGMLLQQSKDLEVDLIQSKFTSAAKSLGFNYPQKTIISMPNTMGI
uniref:Gldg family protein n=1 Tax=Pedobacter sp. TaxID=1411316 RepID=UPI003D7FAC5F